MRILVVGAGALGGYFGGRLAAAGRDVTFLVRPARAEQLRAHGLVIHSPRGDLSLRDVKTITQDALRGPAFDLLLLSCKAYDLEGAIASFAPAVGADTLILPVLNGMRHLDALGQRFGAQAVLGGVGLIASTLNAQREIVHMHGLHTLVFGPLDGHITDRFRAISATLSDAGFDARPSEHIAREMWDKWIFLATLAGGTCLFRAPVGVILATPDGATVLERLFSECLSIAAHNGFAASDEAIARARAMLFVPDSPLTASMLRDVRNGAHTEADHVLGDLIHRGDGAQQAASELTMLRIAYSHLKAYETTLSPSSAVA